MTSWGWARVVGLIVSSSGCVSAGTTPGVPGEGSDLGTHARANVITAAELASVEGPGTVDAVRRLRPAFLRGSVRASSAAPQIAVYVNDQYDGDVGSLATIPVRVIQQIVFLEPVEAHVRFGPWCPCANGVLMVTTRAGNGPS